MESRERLTEKEKKITIAVIVFSIIALIGLIIYITIFVLNSVKENEEKDKKLNFAESSAKSGVVQSEERQAVLLENGILSSKLSQDPERKHSRNTDFTEVAKYQFEKIKPNEEYLLITFSNGKKIEVKLFEKMAPQAVKELKEKVNKGIMDKTNLFKTNAGRSLDANINDNNKLFSSAYVDEIYEKMVPYRGALVVSGIEDVNRKPIAGIFSIVLGSYNSDDKREVKNRSYNVTLDHEMKKRKGVIQYSYLKNPVIGQVVEGSNGLDVLEEIIKENSKLNIEEKRNQISDTSSVIQVQKMEILKK